MIKGGILEFWRSHIHSTRPRVVTSLRLESLEYWPTIASLCTLATASLAAFIAAGLSESDNVPLGSGRSLRPDDFAKNLYNDIVSTADRSWPGEVRRSNQTLNNKIREFQNFVVFIFVYGGIIRKDPVKCRVNFAVGGDCACAIDHTWRTCIHAAL